MGMAASQARYLALTARKTNTEYEGQQINQQRTALANQSADAFNQYLALEVPQPPSTTDFTKVQYTYSDGNIEEAIEDMTALSDSSSDYNYMVSHYHYSDVFTGVRYVKDNPQVRTGYQSSFEKIKTDTITRDESGNYKIGDYTVSQYDENNENEKIRHDAIAKEIPAFEQISPENLGVYVDEINTMHFVDMTKLDSTEETITGYYSSAFQPTYVGNNELSKYIPGKNPDLDLSLEQIKKDNPEDKIANADSLFTYKAYGRTYFATEEELLASANSGKDPLNPTENQNPLNTYYAEPIKTKISDKEKAFIEFDETGRATSIKLERSSAVFSVSTETITDDKAYLDAMNDYNFKKAEYEKKIQDINAKTEIIQQEDRTLELRLRQLDTEQDALQTELESVKKVIDKNVESTFKTFQ